MFTDIDARPGAFYDMGSGFFLPTAEVAFNTEIDVSTRLPVSCMFDIYIATLAGIRVGFYFTGRFEVTNGGGYLLTALQNKKKADRVDVLIKTQELVVYNYPNKGTLAISPKVSDQIELIFREQ